MHRRVGFLLFAAGWGANHFGTMLIVYRAQLGLSPAQLALLFGAYAVGLVPGLVLAGRMSDRRGRRAIVIPATIASAAASVLLAFGAHGFAVLLAGRLAYGLAMGAIMSPGSVWVQELSPGALGPRRATLSLSAGFGLGPLLSAALIELAPAPLVLPYVAHAMAAVVALALVRPVPETASITTKVASAQSSETNASEDERRLARTLLLRQLPVAPWAFAFPAIFIAVLPGLVRAHVARPALYVGLLIGVSLAAGVLVQPLTTRLGLWGDRVGLALGAAGTLLGAWAVATASPNLVYVAGICLGAGYGLVITTGLKIIAQHVSTAHRGRAVGIYYVITYVGFALPFVHALVAKSFGDVRTLELTAAAVVASALVRTVLAAVPAGRGVSSNAAR